MKEVVVKESRETIILGLSDQVYALAGRSNRPRGMPARDLYAAAWTGAIQAVDSFDESRGLKLKTFAERHIRGRILDYLRDLDHLTRRHRRQLREGKAFDEPKILYIDRPSRFNDQVFNIEDPFSNEILGHIENKIDVDLLFKKARLTPIEKVVAKQHFMQGLTVNAVITKTGYSRKNVVENIESAISKFKEIVCIKVKAAGA